MEPGIYSDMLNEKYHADPAVSSSMIMDFLDSPHLYKSKYIDKIIGRDTTPSMEFGTKAHTFILEPTKFEKRYRIMADKLNKNSTQYKKIAEELRERSMSPVELDEYNALLDMRNVIYSNPDFMKILQGYIEYSFFCKDEDSGLTLKCRPDCLYYTDEGAVICDYKTTGFNLDFKTQNYHAKDMLRHIQGAHHKRVVEEATNTPIAKVIYLIQSTKPPYSTMMINMPSSILEQGLQVCQEALNNITKYTTEGYWPTKIYEYNYQVKEEKND